MATTLSPFRVEVPEAVLDDLRTRLDRTRILPGIGTSDRPGGLGGERLRALVSRWLDVDWRAEEERLNAYEQYLAEVRGHRIHVVRVRPPRPAARVVPLLLLHGWPSAFTEYLPLADALTRTSDDELAFDIVIPSLPGFVFSELPEGPLTRAAIAEDLHALMTDVLGYERYGAFGGDIGGGAATWLGALHPDALIGIQLIHPPFPSDDEPRSDEEAAYLRALEAYDETDGGYSAIMGTRPDTIAAALADSPAGLPAWIADKWLSWSDPDCDLDDDLILTTVTIYWVTRTIGPSLRMYRESFGPGAAIAPPHRIDVPTGLSLFRDPNAPPRELTEPWYDLRHYTVNEPGGHFPALENPDAVVRELREFFRPLR